VNITDKFHDIKKLYEQKLTDQQLNYHSNIKQCGNDYEKKIQSLRQEVKELNQKYHFTLEEKEQIKIDFENQVNNIFSSFEIIRYLDSRNLSSNTSK
jgi:hypothetical protein